MIAAYVPLIALVIGQATPTDASKGEEAAARLELMKKSVSGFTMYLADDKGESYRLDEAPCLRFNNSIGGARDGAVFVWRGANGRPEAVTQVFLTPGSVWWQEFSSLAAKPLVAEWRGRRFWAPRASGVEFKLLPGAPKPAETPEQRLRQMHRLARDFTAEDYFKSEAWQPLRMLTKPLARYGKPDSSLVDGALFAFVLTTDPEVFLMLEARQGVDGPEWQYAFAPMTVYKVKASWKGKEVWNLPDRHGPGGSPGSPFYGFQPPGIE